MQRNQPINKYAILAGLIIGGLAGAYCGYLIGFDDSHYHRDTAVWLDLSDLDPWVGLIFGAMLGIVAGVVQAFMLESTVRLPLAGCLAVFIVVDGAICTVIASHIQIDEAAITQRENAIQAAIKGEDIQATSDYSTLSAHLSVLQYPGSHEYHWQSDYPFEFTTTDDQDTVAAYYQLVLKAPFRKTGVVMGPAYETWEVMTHYAGVPIHVIISNDQLSDGAKTEVTLSETTEAVVFAWTASAGSAPASGTTATTAHSILPPAPPKPASPESAPPGQASVSSSPAGSGIAAPSNPPASSSQEFNSPMATSEPSILPPARPPASSSPSASASSAGSAAPQPAHP
jgi:hypothetical protein